MATTTTKAPIVQYWDDPYMPKYMGDTYREKYFSLVDEKVLYEGLDRLAIKVTGDTTGVPEIDWFKDLEHPDIRQPFDVMVGSMKNANI